MIWHEQKKLFKSLKQRQSKITWVLWISANAKTCKSYANKHTTVHRLPQVENTAYLLKELYTISHGIGTIFSKNNVEALEVCNLHKLLLLSEKTSKLASFSCR